MMDIVKQRNKEKYAKPTGKHVLQKYTVRI
jgi:hypothetical protein